MRVHALQGRRAVLGLCRDPLALVAPLPNEEMRLPRRDIAQDSKR